MQLMFWLLILLSFLDTRDFANAFGGPQLSVYV